MLVDWDEVDWIGMNRSEVDWDEVDWIGMKWTRLG